MSSPSTPYGPSMLELTNGTNNYNGGTTIENGRLSITTPTALGTGAVMITGANSQLLVDEVSGTIPNDFTLGGGGAPTSTFYPYGNATMVFHNDGQTATLSGTITLSGDAKIRSYSSGGTTIFSTPIGGTGGFDARGRRGGLQSQSDMGSLLEQGASYNGNTPDRLRRISERDRATQRRGAARRDQSNAPR